MSLELPPIKAQESQSENIESKIRKPLENMQKAFVEQQIVWNEDKSKIGFAKDDPNGKHETVYYTLVNKKTTEFKVPKELFNTKMRIWITEMLVKLPYARIFSSENGNSQQELETYSEMVQLEPQEMEWGVVQKLISLLLIQNPDFFGEDSDLRRKMMCYHDDRGYDMIKYKTCPDCGGLGWGAEKSTPNHVGEFKLKPTDVQIKLASYLQIVESCKKIQHYITLELNKIKESCLEEIWYEKMTQSDRFNANGLIAKYSGKKSNLITQ